MPELGTAIREIREVLPKVNALVSTAQALLDNLRVGRVGIQIEVFGVPITISLKELLSSVSIPKETAEMANPSSGPVDLKTALSNAKATCTPEQKQTIDEILKNPQGLAEVEKVVDVLPTSTHQIGPAGKLGDGTFLKMLLDNLPQIWALIQMFLKKPATP
jgi:hypothetical protein